MRFAGCLLIVALLPVVGCQSKPPKNAATLSMHLPAGRGLPESRRTTVALMSPAISLDVNRIPVLREADLDTVELKGEGDNFLMRLVFGIHGTIELDRVSNNNRGELIVIFINNIPVAAPQLKHRIVDGVFEFTPNLSREEAQKLADGLNAMVKYLEKRR